MEEKIKTPKHLSAESKRIWADINARYKLELYHLAILKSALEWHDQEQEARRIIRAEGQVITAPNGAKRRHPAVENARNAHVQFLAAMKMLGIDDDEETEMQRGPGRPPRGYSV